MLMPRLAFLFYLLFPCSLPCAVQLLSQLSSQSLQSPDFDFEDDLSFNLIVGAIKNRDLATLRDHVGVTPHPSRKRRARESAILDQAYRFAVDFFGAFPDSCGEIFALDLKRLPKKQSRESRVEQPPALTPPLSADGAAASNSVAPERMRRRKTAAMILFGSSSSVGEAAPPAGVGSTAERRSSCMISPGPLIVEDLEGFDAPGRGVEVETVISVSTPTAERRASRNDRQLQESRCRRHSLPAGKEGASNIILDTAPIHLSLASRQSVLPNGRACSSSHHQAEKAEAILAFLEDRATDMGRMEARNLVWKQLLEWHRTASKNAWEDVDENSLPPVKWTCPWTPPKSQRRWAKSKSRVEGLPGAGTDAPTPTTAGRAGRERDDGTDSPVSSLSVGVLSTTSPRCTSPPEQKGGGRLPARVLKNDLANTQQDWLLLRRRSASTPAIHANMFDDETSDRGCVKTSSGIKLQHSLRKDRSSSRSGAADTGRGVTVGEWVLPPTPTRRPRSGSGSRIGTASTEEDTNLSRKRSSYLSSAKFKWR